MSVSVPGQKGAEKGSGVNAINLSLHLQRSEKGSGVIVFGGTSRRRSEIFVGNLFQHAVTFFPGIHFEPRYHSQS